jgi:hypothetical protein
LQELGFKDAAIDSEGNVMALQSERRPRRSSGSRRISTRVPEGTDVSVKKGRRHPGAGHRR